MKVCLRIIIALFLFTELSAQAKLKEDFEAYNDGDLITIISSDWKLWPRAKDAHVSSKEAASGKNSLKLESGNDTDLYFPFKNRFTAGSIQFSMNLLIPKESNGYFSFQGEEMPGVIWSMQCYLDNNGYFRIVDDRNNRVTNIYPQGSWFNMSVDINLETNLWRFYIDGACVGSYIQDHKARQSIASLALYPDGDHSLFYVDDISFVHSGKAKNKKLKHDASITQVRDSDSMHFKSTSNKFFNVNGQELQLECTIKNLGLKDIKNLELKVEHNGETLTQKHELELKPDQDTTLQIDKKLVFNGEQSSSISIGRINRKKDQSRCNISYPISLQGFTIQPHKKVWIEESTGTWCGWCPRGDVFIKYLSEKYEAQFVAIAVHQDDPMELLQWLGQRDSRKTKENEAKTGLVNFIKAFPSALVDRTEVVDPGNLELAFLQSASKESAVRLIHSAKWDPQSRELDVTVTVNLKESITEDLKLVLGLTEDRLTGESKEWAQMNFYSGGVQGAMGGYEILPAKVPASEMIYDHVARLLLTPFEGELITMEENEIKMNEVIRTFTCKIPGEWNIDKMNIVSAVSIGSAAIENANKSTITEVLKDR